LRVPREDAVPIGFDQAARRKVAARAEQPVRRGERLRDGREGIVGAKPGNHAATLPSGGVVRTRSAIGLRRVAQVRLERADALRELLLERLRILDRRRDDDVLAL